VLGLVHQLVRPGGQVGDAQADLLARLGIVQCAPLAALIGGNREAPRLGHVQERQSGHEGAAGGHCLVVGLALEVGDGHGVLQTMNRKPAEAT
jgi:hypothetical protein